MCTSDGEPQYYALTFLTYDPQDDKIYAIDSEIRDGGMIGKTFAKHGYTIRKNVIDVFTVKLTPELKAKLQVTDEYGKGRLTEFYIRHDDSSPSIYSHILEIKPHHLEAADVDGFDVAQLNPASDVLARHNISTDDVWDHLPDAASTDEWVDRDSEYTAAQHESLPEIMGWRTRIEKQLHVTLYSAGEHQRPLS